MKSYLRAFREGEGRPGISQEKLLRRMAAVGDEYSERFSHATVSRWEAGTTRPTVDRLKTFGEALHLSDTEVAGLILLGGLAPDFKAAALEVGLEISDSHENALDAPPHIPGEGRDQHSIARPQATPASTYRSMLRFVAIRLLLTGTAVMLLGMFLSWVGWNENWMPEAYILLTTGFVLFQGLIWSDKGAGLRDFFWVSVFFVVAVPALQFAPLGMDHFGFYALWRTEAEHLCFTLAMLLSLMIASISALMFQVLWTTIGRRHISEGNLLVGALWATLPHATFAYGVILVFSNASIWIQSLIVMPVVAIVFTGLLLIRNTSVGPTLTQRRFLLHAVFSVALVGAIVGILIIVAVFLLPDVPRVMPDHNLLTTWEIDFQGMGYTQDEALERLNVGYMWHAMYLYLYMVFVMCGHLLVALYKMVGNDSTGPDAVHAEALEASQENGGVRRVTKNLLLWPLTISIARLPQTATRCSTD